MHGDLVEKKRSCVAFHISCFRLRHVSQRRRVIASCYWRHFSERARHIPATSHHHHHHRRLPTRWHHRGTLGRCPTVCESFLSRNTSSNTLSLLLLSESRWPDSPRAGENKKKISRARTSGCPAIRPISPCSKSIWKEGLLYIEYGPVLLCTVLKLPGTQF